MFREKVTFCGSDEGEFQGEKKSYKKIVNLIARLIF
jgi:hypothetical protein